MIDVHELDRVEPVPNAIVNLSTARQVVTDAEAAIERARAAASTASDAVARRRSRRSLEELSEAVLDARSHLQTADRDLLIARRTAFNTIAPIIQEEYLRRLPKLETALRALEDAAGDLRALETVAGQFALHDTASVAPARSALPPGTHLGERLIATLTSFSTWCDRLTREISAAA